MDRFDVANGVVLVGIKDREEIDRVKEELKAKRQVVTEQDIKEKQSTSCKVKV